MTEQVTEKPTPEATPAPVAGTSASEQNPAPTPATTTAEKPETKTPANTKTPEKPGEFFYQQREAKREKKAQERVIELEKKLSEIESKAEKPKEPEPVSFLDDPERALAQTKEQAKREAIEAIRAEQASAKAEADYQQAVEKSAEFILTRSHVSEDPALKADIFKVMSEKYAHLAFPEAGGRDPETAALRAYIDVCAMKGIQPDLGIGKTPGTFDATQGKAASGTKPTAPATGKRTWNKREAEKYLMESVSDKAKYAARTAEIEEAKRDGRIK